MATSGYQNRHVCLDKRVSEKGMFFSIRCVKEGVKKQNTVFLPVRNVTKN